MSELALLRDWTIAEPSTTARDRAAVLRLFLECGKDSLADITAPELAAFLLTHLPARAGQARKMYDSALPAFFAWALEAGYCSTDPAWVLTTNEEPTWNAPHAPVPAVALESVALLRAYREYRLGTGFALETMRVQIGYLLRLFASERVGSHEEVGEDEVVALLNTHRGKPTARQSCFFALKSFFAWAHRRGHMPTNPTVDMKVKGPREKDPDAYSPEEIVALLDAARLRRDAGPRHAALILLAYSLGLRRSEVCGITLDDVDWVNSRVHIRPEIAKGGQGRYVEMNEYAVEAIEVLRPFANGTLAGIDKSWFTTLVHEAATAAGFPPGRRNAHLLRSSFATNLLREGVPISVVSKLLGHSKVSTTSRYLAVVDGERHAAVATMKLPPSAAAAKGQLRWKATGTGGQE